MPYGEILTSAGKLIWKFKILWLFGLLASCTGGAGRFNLNFGLNAGDINTVSRQLPELLRPLGDFLTRISALIEKTPWNFFALVFILVCGLGIIAWLIGSYGRAGLALGAWQADAGAENLEPSLLHESTLLIFWRVAAVALLVGLPGFAVALIFMATLAFTIFGVVSQFSPAANAILVFLTIPLCCILVPLFWALGILSELSTVAVAGENRGVLDGLKRAWELFKRNLGPVLLMGLLVLVLQILAGVVMGLIFAPLGIGALIGFIALDQPLKQNLGLLVGLFLILLAVSLAFGALFNAYTGTLWALTFRRLVASEPTQGPVTFPPPTPPVYLAAPTFPNPSSEK